MLPAWFNLVRRVSSAISASRSYTGTGNCCMQACQQIEGGRFPVIMQSPLQLLASWVGAGFSASSGWFLHQRWLSRRLHSARSAACPLAVQFIACCSLVADAGGLGITSQQTQHRAQHRATTEVRPTLLWAREARGQKGRTCCRCGLLHAATIALWPPGNHAGASRVGDGMHRL